VSGSLDLESGNFTEKVTGFSSRIANLFREKAHIVGEAVGTFKSAMDLQSSFQKLQEMEKAPEEGGAGGENVGGAGRRGRDQRSEVVTEERGADGLTESERQRKRDLEQEAASKGMVSFANNHVNDISKINYTC
jgi:hypothetical protein